ncbi:hypothetical protein BDW22DRAFT_1348346 [Trametopsis cervina]|nr:hypothetical protein BDW22DRAFT_1348346 [Trametopsis cervina]
MSPYQALEAGLGFTAQFEWVDSSSDTDPALIFACTHGFYRPSNCAISVALFWPRLGSTSTTLQPFFFDFHNAHMPTTNVFFKMCNKHGGYYVRNIAGLQLIEVGCHKKTVRV